MKVCVSARVALCVALTHSMSLQTFDSDHVPIRTKQAKALFAHINKTYDTLAFCKRFLAYDKLEKFDGALNQLCKAGLVTAYPPL